MYCTYDSPPGYEERTVNLTLADGGQRKVQATWTDGIQREHEVQTDGSGRFEVRTPPGDYLVDPEPHGQHVDEAVPVTIPGDGGSLQVRLASLPEASVRLDGTVHGEEGPTANAMVEVYNQAWGTRETVFTDENGTFAMDVRPGYLEIKADQRGHLAYLTSRPVDEDEEIELAIELASEPPDTAQLSGTIVDASTDEPIAGTHVLVEDQRTGDHVRATTDDQGRFQIDVDPGQHRFVAQADDHYRLTQTIQLSGGTTERTFELTPGQPRLGSDKPHPTVQTETTGEITWERATGLATSIGAGVLGIGVIARTVRS
jgi:hypothetical protein